MNNKEKNNKEHILVCLSSAPSNAKIIEIASKMANAFNGSLTVLYIQNMCDNQMSKEEQIRLQETTRIAQEAGANIATIYGDEITYQIAEFARISKVTKMVIARSNMQKRHFGEKNMITEKLISIAPDIEIYIIPDSDIVTQYHKTIKKDTRKRFPSLKDLLITVLILIGITGIGLIFSRLNFKDVNIITLYILGVLLTSLYTKSYSCCIINSIAGVSLFNFVFTEPKMSFHAYDAGYAATFAIMLLVSLITGTLTSKLKLHAKVSAQSAFRTKVLFDTNQLLQKAKDENEIYNITATQLMKLLDKDIVVYPECDGKIGKGYLFSKKSDSLSEFQFSSYEMKVVEWVFKNKKRAGAFTNQYNDAKCQYLSIRINNKVYGVIGIYFEEKPLESFEQDMILSMLGECALAIENTRNAKEKEKETVRAENEKLRANLLRTISHDLRTPLTAISGNAGYLLSAYKTIDEEIEKQIFTDIYDDAQWLISLVENLLSITRIEDGSINLDLKPELMEEVIEEALKHINRKRNKYNIKVNVENDFLMAKMDAKLIVQVIINIIDNAIKYTPEDSEIIITLKKSEKNVVVSIADNGPGIKEEYKKHIFEMFFCGENKIADSRRSLGLGLALCKSIITLHGGTITVDDNVPNGAIFTFTLPLDEVNLNE